MTGRFLLLASLATMITATGTAASSQSTARQEILQSPPRQHIVVLVHGFKDNSSKMQWMANHLRKQGFEVYTPTLAPSWGQVDLQELARQLSAYINAKIPPGEKFDLVGFSMGGLVCRYYLQRMGGLSRVDRLITLGTPNHGTVWACFSTEPGCRQMRPNSDFLNDLNSDIGALNKIDYTSIWTPLDLMIVPSGSSRTPAGRNVQEWELIHPFLVWSPFCIRKVASLLKS